MSLANALYGLFVLPESLTPRAALRRSRGASANPVGALKLLRSHPELLGLRGVDVLQQLAHAVLPSVAVLYMGYRYGWDTQSVGLLLAGVGVCSIIVQGVLVRPAS